MTNTNKFNRKAPFIVNSITFRSFSTTSSRRIIGGNDPTNRVDILARIPEEILIALPGYVLDNLRHILGTLSPDLLEPFIELLRLLPIHLLEPFINMFRFCPNELRQQFIDLILNFARSSVELLGTMTGDLFIFFVWPYISIGNSIY